MGADAIYLGGLMFGARASATNFSQEEIKKVVEEAHAVGVKIYVTMNTLIHDFEMDSCLNMVEELDTYGVDAFIIQDLGLCDVIKHRFPHVEIHASTQMHIHNLEGLRHLKKWGFTRAVVARETSLELLEKMCQEDIEIEAFVQGAYCVSYSGQCHMSHNIGGRSANRGECAQACRLPYELVCEENGQYKKIDTEGKYLLSLKDLNALNQVKALVNAGVCSFKIEGRMKRPEYVALMTSLYRKAIDCALNNEPFNATTEMVDEMKKVFNRGFTDGYLTKQDNRTIMSTLRPNHQGIEIGKVVKFHHDKMSIQVNGILRQGDGIRILGKQNDAGFVVNYLYNNDRLVNKAENEIIDLKRVKGVQIGDKVMKTSDCEQLNELQKQITMSKRKVTIKAHVKAHINEPFVLTFIHPSHQVEVQSEQLVEEAKNQPLTVEKIEKQISKLGNTPFINSHCTFDVGENISFPLSLINELRRQAAEQLEKRLKENTREKLVALPMHDSSCELTHEICVTVSTLEQFQEAKKYNVLIDVIGKELYETIKEEVHEYVYPRVVHQGYSRVGVVSELGGVQNGCTASPYMNCMNANTAHYLFSQGCRKVAFSYECSDDQKQQLVEEYQTISGHLGNFEVVLYVRQENMVNETCLVNAALADNNKTNCRLCKNKRYYLKDSKNEYYPCRGDEDCRMHIYHSKVDDVRENWPMYQEMGITNARLIFTFETGEEVGKILTQFFEENR